MFVQILIAVAILGVIAAAVMPNVAYYVSKEKRAETAVVLEDLRDALSKFYSDNAFLLDSTTDGSTVTINGVTLRFPEAGEPLSSFYTPCYSTLIRAGGETAGETYCVGANFPLLDASASPTYGDAWGDCFLIYVTPQQEAPDGIKYRDFYVVSAGENRRVDFNGVDVGDDLVVMVSGYGVERELYDETKKKLQLLKESLEIYFKATYLQDPLRDAGKDYFLRRLTDGSPVTDSILDNTCLISGEDPTTGNCLVPLPQVAADLDGDGNPDTQTLLDTLGLLSSDLTDAWGNEILFDNASFHVRSPQAGKDTPFSSRLVARTPWGEEIVVYVRQGL